MPLTLGILIVAVGALLAAFLPVLLALTAVFVTGTRISPLAIRDPNRSLRTLKVAKVRSASKGLARHSAMTKGSFPETRASVSM